MWAKMLKDTNQAGEEAKQRELGVLCCGGGKLVCPQDDALPTPGSGMGLQSVPSLGQRVAGSQKTR